MANRSCFDNAVLFYLHKRPHPRTEQFIVWRIHTIAPDRVRRHVERKWPAATPHRIPQSNTRRFCRIARSRRRALPHCPVQRRNRLPYQIALYMQVRKRQATGAAKSRGSVQRKRFSGQRLFKHAGPGSPSEMVSIAATIGSEHGAAFPRQSGRRRIPTDKSG